MKNDEKSGWKLARAGIGLMAAGWLLGYLSLSLENFGLDGVLYYVVVVVLCVIYVAAIYVVVRKFFGKKK